MTPQEISKLASEAGCGGIDNFEVIEKFANLVSAAEQEKFSTDLIEYGNAMAAAERNKLAAWMIQFGFATGHGNTMEELVDALGSEIVDRIEFEIDAAVARDRKVRDIE